MTVFLVCLCSKQQLSTSGCGERVLLFFYTNKIENTASWFLLVFEQNIPTSLSNEFRKLERAMFVIYIHSCLKIEWHQEELINVCITLLFVEFGRENGRNEVWEKYINLEAIFYIFSIVTDYPTRSIIFCISKNMRTISAKVSYKKGWNVIIIWHSQHALMCEC